MRYKATSYLLKDRTITTFKQIFTVTPITVVAHDMHINNRLLERKLYGPDWFTLREMAAFAMLFDIEPEFLITFIARNRKKDLLADGISLKKTLFKQD